MDKKYQVFVSSTYEDLRAERQEVIHALLELDCIPSGMELFPAADEDQWSLIKGVIDECDYYILIIGGRYGSVDKEGVGYTEREYRYALESGKPIIAFLHKDPDSLPKNQTEKTEEGQRKFEEFRDFAREKMCKFWSTHEELGSVVSRSLIMLQKKHPGVGWVRGDSVLSRDASIEMLELRKKVDGLEADLEAARTHAPVGSENLAQGKDLFEVNYKCTVSDGYREASWDDMVKFSWDSIFYYLSPLMMNEASDGRLRQTLDDVGSGVIEPKMKKKMEEMDGEGVKFCSAVARDEDLQTIKVQLRALGLIRQSERNRSVKDSATYWTLTPYGDSVMNRLRAIGSGAVNKPVNTGVST